MYGLCREEECDNFVYECIIMILGKNKIFLKIDVHFLFANFVNFLIVSINNFCWKMFILRSQYPKFQLILCKIVYIFWKRIYY